MFISYAHNLEDVMLWRALKHVTNGFYIDVGACYPLVGSVSLAFYERGWRGVHVEPLPRIAEMLRQARPDETVIQAAVDSNGSLLKFYEILEDPGMSTGETKIVETHQTAGLKSREIEVPCLKLASLLERYADRNIHWLKIDVEGMEKRVIQSWEPSKVRPWILVVEATFPMTQFENYQDWEPIVLSLAYKFVYFDGLNRFYVSKAHKDLKKAFLVGPNVFDDFNIDSTSFFCRYVNERHRSEIAEREQLLATQLQIAQEEQHRREQEEAARERDLTQTIIQTKQEMEGLLRQVSEREKQFGEKESALRCEQAEREKELAEQLHAGQRDLLKRERDWAQAEKGLSHEITCLKSEIQALKHAQHLQAQQHNFELTTKQDELSRLRQTFADFEDQLKAQILSEQQTCSQLRQKLAAVEANLARTQASLFWRLTWPLRKIASFTAPRKDLSCLSKSVEQMEPPLVIKTIASVSRFPEIQQLSMEPNMHSFPPDTHLKIPTVATRLDELLAYQDEAFIYCCYQTLLGRDPDEVGLRYYLARLRTGVSKMQILNQIWCSKEAKEYAARLPRFGSAIRRYRWAHKPIVGWFFRPFSKVDSKSGTELKLRGLEDQLSLLEEEYDLYSDLPVASSLDDLMSHQDQSFIFCAYRTLLGRDPDEEGLQYYLARLHSGITKMHILGQIWCSKEAKEYAARLPRFGSAIRRYRWAHKPIIGWIVKPFSKFEGNSTTERKLRSIENMLFLLNKEINELHCLLADQTETEKGFRRLLQSIAPLQSSDSKSMEHCSPRVKGIYSQLRTEATIYSLRQM